MQTGAVTSGGSEAPTRPRGPREQVRRRVLDTTRDLVETGGYAAFTVDALVMRSGVSKTTIYRWWDNRAEVALDMMEDAYGLPAGTDPAEPVLTQAERFLASDMTYLSGPAGTVLRGVLADSQHRQSLAATMETRFLGPRRQRLRTILEGGIAAGDLRGDVDLDLVCSLLLAPLLQSLLTGHPRHRPGLPREILDQVLDGARPGSPGKHE